MSDSEPTGIADRSPQKVGAVIALIQTGVTHYTAIARATGLTEEDVRRIDEAKDEHVRELALRGTGRDVYYHLRSKITCPRCGSIIYLVPCVACTIAKSAGITEGQSERPKISEGRAVFPANRLDESPYPEEQHHGSELATTEDILSELRRRQMRFVFAGVENSNDARCARVFCAGLGQGRQDLLRLIRQLHFLFQSADDAESAVDND